MKHKIIAIGGGEIGAFYDGKKHPVETMAIDEEIVNLSNKKPAS